MFGVKAHYLIHLTVYPRQALPLADPTWCSGVWTPHTGSFLCLVCSPSPAPTGFRSVPLLSLAFLLCQHKLHLGLFLRFPHPLSASHFPSHQDTTWKKGQNGHNYCISPNCAEKAQLRNTFTKYSMRKQKILTDSCLANSSVIFPLM